MKKKTRNARKVKRTLWKYLFRRSNVLIIFQYTHPPYQLSLNHYCSCSFALRIIESHVIWIFFNFSNHYSIFANHSAVNVLILRHSIHYWIQFVREQISTPFQNRVAMMRLQMVSIDCFTRNWQIGNEDEMDF